MRFLSYTCFQDLLRALTQAGYTCVGPQVKGGTIVYETLQHIKQLPWGIQDKQSPGHYSLEKTNSKRAFDFSNGPQAIKPLLFKPQETLWEVTRSQEGKLNFTPKMQAPTPLAIIGARACDIAAMQIQDQVFLKGPHPDLRYQARREQLFIVGVNCSRSSDNCFCVSAQSGPEVTSAYDLLMTEIESGFLIQSGSKRGEDVLHRLALPPSNPMQIKQGESVKKQARQMQTKRIAYDNGPELAKAMKSQLNHPQYEQIAKRCLACGNCTSVCPTCFCHSQQEKPTLDGSRSVHERQWDSCFNAGHSEMSGKPLRDAIQKRYRQWLTHKVSSWFEQFGTSGCVGCGRCISWCPTGIDMTEEIAVITGEAND